MNKELSRRRIVLNGQDIEYELQRKQVKNINLRIRQDGTVYVSASPTVSLTVIEKFMQSRSGLILSAIEGAKLAQRPLNDPAGEPSRSCGSLCRRRAAYRRVWRPATEAP